MGKNGGARPGAGRKAGGQNALTKAVKDAVQERTSALIGEGLTPLEYMIEVMRDENQDPNLRLKAAQDAAVYVHRKQPADLNVDNKHTYVGEEMTLIHEAKE
jgi:hypothetical protein